MNNINTKKIILAVIVPVFERGKNGKTSFSRTRGEMYTLFDTPELANHLDECFSFNKKGYAYITIENARNIRRLFKVAEPSNAVIYTDRNGNTKIDNSFPIRYYDDNAGINGEFNALDYFNWKKASKEEDKNGIDFFVGDMPLQLKTCHYGKTEKANYNATDMKKSGISVINATRESLMQIITG